MPLIKKFKLTYKQIPKVFSMPEQVFLSKTADLIPDNVSEQTEEQRKQVSAAVKQLDKDLDRTCYVDLDGRTTSGLKSVWLTHNLSGVSLTKGVYPSYTQGNSTGAVIGEILHDTQFAFPLSIEEPESFSSLQPKTKKIRFAYRNAKGEPAGFSLVAAPDGDHEGNHKGWIISTIQNTTAKPEDREVAVLASSNYVTTKAKTTIDTANPNQLDAALKAAINNDKIYELVKGIFNQDGSLNAGYIAQLSDRIVAASGQTNIDDRDRKMAQLNCLFDLSKQTADVSVQKNIIQVKKQISEEIDIFK